MAFLADNIPEHGMFVPKARLGWGQISDRSEPPGLLLAQRVGMGCTFYLVATYPYEAVSRTKRCVAFVKPPNELNYMISCNLLHCMSWNLSNGVSFYI